MVKTRGLARALDRVIGRGLGKEDGDDSNGAPQLIEAVLESNKH